MTPAVSEGIVYVTAVASLDSSLIAYDDGEGPSASMSTEARGYVYSGSTSNNIVSLSCSPENVYVPLNLRQ